MRESFESSRKAIAEEKGGIDAEIDKTQQNGARALQIVISESRRITLQSSPNNQNKRLKACGASSTVRVYSASVGAGTKNLSPTDILRVFSSDSHAYSEYPAASRASFITLLLQSTLCWNFNRNSRFSAL